MTCRKYGPYVPSPSIVDDLTLKYFCKVHDKITN